ncbi:MAG: hypothetical protein QOD98_3144 [Nocardioidaceae bacterium]|nr:hypothetical protein [Nocardioidaceae bacterium]
MNKYVVFAVDGDEDKWETLSAEEKDQTYDADNRFLALLAERGGKVVGGQELTHSRKTRWLTRDRAGQVLVTDGPFAETVEQISGFYIVECDDLDDLTEALREMLPAHSKLQIRPVLLHS